MRTDPPARLVYRLTRLLGKGGFASVYEARREPGNAPVAVKLLHAEFAREPSARRTMVNEALACAALSHEGLVRLLDIDEQPGLGLFLVAELVQGISLSRWLETDGRIEEGLVLVAKMLEGLAAAHAAGVVHGDLKPDNILVTDEARVKLCDFGIAQVFGPSKQPRALRIVAGTPTYMAPEQFEGEGLDPRTDLYATGAILHEIISEEPLFPTGSLGELLLAKRMAPSVAFFDRRGRLLSPELRRLLERLLSPALPIRPRFAASVAEQLRRFAGGMDASERRMEGSLTTTVVLTAWTPRATGGTELLPPSAPASSGEESEHRVGQRVHGTNLPGAAFVHVRPPPFLGRERELATLRATIASVAAQRQSAVVVITGPSGVGKSRLAEWAVAQCELTASMESAALRFVAGGGSKRSLRALVARLYAPSGETAHDTHATMQWLGESEATEGVDVEALAAWLAAPPEEDSIDPTTAASLAYRALRALSLTRPICLWFDDLPLARDGTLELTERLANGLDAAILVVATVPSDLAEESGRAERFATLRASSRTQTLALSPLEPHQNALVLEAAGLSPACAERVASAVRGVPLFFVQLVQGWIDRGLLDAGPEGLVPRTPIEDLLAEISRTSAPGDVVRRRVEAILARGRAPTLVAFVAALLGPFCADETLRAVALAMKVDTVSTDLAIEEALLRGVLVADGTEYALCQPLFRSELLARARLDDAFAELCGHCAEVLAPGAEKRPRLAVHIAVLLRDAGAREASYDTMSSATEAIARFGDCEQADRQLLVLRRWAEADGLAREDSRRHQFAYVEARIAFYRHDPRRARRVLDDLLARLSKTFDTQRTIAAEWLYGHVAYALGEAAEATRHFERAARLADEAGAGTQWHALVLHGLALVGFFRGDFEAATPVLARAIELSADRPWLHWFFLVERANLAAALGDDIGARRWFQRARALPSRDAHQIGNERESEFFLALARGERRDVSLVEEHARTLTDGWRRTGCRLLLAAHDVTFGLPTAVESATAALDAFEQIPHDEPVAQWCLVRLKDGLSNLGRDDLARRAETLFYWRRTLANT